MLKRSNSSDDRKACQKRVRADIEPKRKHLVAIIETLRHVINLPDVLACTVTAYFGPTWWKCSSDNYSQRVAYVDATVENAIALTATLPIKMHSIFPDHAFMVPNLRINRMYKSRKAESQWVKCASFYHSIKPDVHEHVAEFFRSTSSSPFFEGSWFKQVAQLFAVATTPHSNDEEDDYFSRVFDDDAANYKNKIRTNVFDFLFSTKYVAIPSNGPLTIIVFALTSIAVTQNLESEIFPRLFLWAYGLNSVSNLRLEFREILNYNLSLVLNLGERAIDHRFYFNS